MDKTLMLFYTVCHIVFAMLDIWLAVQAYRHRKKTRGAVSLSLVCAFAAVGTLTYLGSVLFVSETAVSIFSSFHFASIDFLVYSLLLFAGQLTERKTIRFEHAAMKVLAAVGILDAIVLATNPFTGAAVTYSAIPNVSITHFSYSFQPLYYLHLAYDYVIIALIILVVASKVVRTPRQYRDQYLYFILALLVIVGINGVYLFVPVEGMLRWLDFSILGYSVGLFIIYWSLFSYTHSTMLEKLSRSIFFRIDLAIVMFDNNGYLVMENEKAVDLFGDMESAKRVDIKQFLSHCRMPYTEETDADQYTVQCNVESAKGGERVALCQYYRLKDARGKVLGYVYLFDDRTEEIDPLTGFLSWNAFEKYAENDAQKTLAGKYPAALVLDIDGIERINESLGHDAGDAKLIELVALMRENLPDASLYVRGRNAELIAISYESGEHRMKETGERIKALFHGSLQFGAAADASGDKGHDIMLAVNMAERAMRNKKLLDPESSRSQILSSLVRALKESDSDTEAHVKRTQYMGYQLGLRLKLSDLQLSQLSLLCLLHDIGKVGVPLEILNKPGKLTDAEWKMLQSHTQKGYEIAISSQETEGIADMILHHHERWDGHGYPDGIAGMNIPVLSRIISVVDSYDAMVNDRIYRKAMSKEKALAELDKCAGSQFDPIIVAEFKQVIEEHPEYADMMVRGSTVEIAPAGAVLMKAVEPTDKQDFRNMSKVMQCGEYFLDKDDYFVEGDKNFEEMTGYKPADLVNRKVMQMDFIPREDQAEYAAITSEQVQKYNAANIKHRFIKADGTIIEVLCYGRRYFDSSVKNMRTDIVITALGQADREKELSNDEQTV